MKSWKSSIATSSNKKRAVEKVKERGRKRKAKERGEAAASKAEPEYIGGGAGESYFADVAVRNPLLARNSILESGTSQED